MCLTTSEPESQGHPPSPKQQGLPFPGSPAHTFLSAPPPIQEEEPRQEAAGDKPCDHRLSTLRPRGQGGRLWGSGAPALEAALTCPSPPCLPPPGPDCPLHTHAGSLQPLARVDGGPSFTAPQPRQTGSGSRGQAETAPPGGDLPPPGGLTWQRLGQGSRPGAALRAELQECGVLAVGAAPALRRRQLARPAGGQGAAQAIPGCKRGRLGLLARPARPGMLLGPCAPPRLRGALL